MPITFRAERDTELEVFKYPLKMNEQVCIELPRGATVLSFDFQPTYEDPPSKKHPKPMLWALVDRDEASLVRRFFRIYATGKSIRAEEGITLRFVGTTTVDYTQETWHLFEIM